MLHAPPQLPSLSEAAARPVRRLVRRPAAALPAPEPPQLLRPAASCPRCGARPAMRVTRDMVRAVTGQPDDARMGTYQCQRRGCGAVYDLLAGAYHRAT